MDPVSIAVIAALAGAWVLQIFLSNWQMRRFHRKSQELRRRGSHMAIGVAGNMYKRKTYAVLVTDDQQRVAAAGKLSGFTILADLKPVPEVEMMHLDRIGKGDPPQGVSPKTWAALDHAAGFIRRKLAKASTEGGDREDIP